MILFVFEGAEREPRVFRTLEHLFFGQGERIVCSFGNNIYELYRQLQEFDGDGDIVSCINGLRHPDDALDKVNCSFIQQPVEGLLLLFGQVVIVVRVRFEKVLQDVFGEEAAYASEVFGEGDFADVALDVVQARGGEVGFGLVKQLRHLVGDGPWRLRLMSDGLLLREAGILVLDDDARAVGDV